MNRNYSQTYRSKDLMLSAALLAKGFPLMGTENEGTHVVFLFDDFSKAKDIEQEWWSGSLIVNALKYSESIKRLKNLVHAKLCLA